MNALLLCLGVAGILTIILGFIALLRYLSHRETIAMAEKGLIPPAAKNNKPLCLFLSSSTTLTVSWHVLPYILT